MKKIVLVIMLLSLTGILSYAQQRVVEKTFTIQEEGKLGLNLRFGDHIEVEGWSRDEISFRATVEINNGRLNDALLLNYSKQDRGLHISADFDKDRLKQGSLDDCPDRSVTSSVWNGASRRYVVCSEITYELRVPEGIDLKLESISADIELQGLKGPVTAKSISGFVDLSWSQQWGAELSMKTISGEAYSDLDNIRFSNKKEASPLVGYELRGRIGNGGPELVLESISGDIYLRKI